MTYAATEVFHIAVFLIKKDTGRKAVLLNLCKLRMLKSQILIEELLQKYKTTEAISKRMEYLKVYALLIICHSEQILIVPALINICSRKIILFIYLRRLFIILFKIVPEHARAQAHPET